MKNSDDFELYKNPKSIANTIESLFASHNEKSSQNLPNEEHDNSFRYPSLQNLSRNDANEPNVIERENNIDSFQVAEENKFQEIIGIENSIEENYFNHGKRPNLDNYTNLIREDVGKFETKTPSVNVINVCFRSNGDPKICTDSYLVIHEKEQIKDLIGFHKVYEIQLLSSAGEKVIKCYRRYDNFYKFNSKLKRKFPFLIIPRLPPKNALAKIISIDSEFYNHRLIMLNFYLNFIFNSETLAISKEFFKFINDAEFDDEFFSEDDNPFSYYPISLGYTETLHTKVIGVFSNIFGNREQLRKINDTEIILGRMHTHFKRILENQQEIKANISTYLRLIRTEGEEYKGMSNTCYYLKDAFHQQQGIFLKFYEISWNNSDINKKEYDFKAKFIENKYEAYISLLSGLCDAFEKYEEFIRIYENVIKAHKYAKTNNLDNLNTFMDELNHCEHFKNKFDQILKDEANSFINIYQNTFTEIIDEFKYLVKIINSQIHIKNLSI